MSSRTLLFLLLLLWVTAVQAEQLQGRVLWVYDGDTLEVEKVGKVRLLGIDTPEHEASSRDRYYHNKFAIEAQTLRRISRQAKDFNIHQARGQLVVLECDNVRRDKHQRLLAYVYLPGGAMLNRLLLENGLAAVFRRYDFRYKDEFLHLEAQARQNGKGLWAH